MPHRRVHGDFAVFRTVEQPTIPAGGSGSPRRGRLDQRRWSEQVDHSDPEHCHSQDQELGTKNLERIYIANMLRNLISQLLNNALFIYTYESKLCCYI